MTPNHPHANRLSAADQALLDRTFTTDDPAALPGLLDRLPEGLAHPDIAFRYDLNGARATRLRCAVCQGARHLKGFVVKVGEGKALLGHQCGRQAFGLIWEDVTAQFDAERDRQLDLRRYEHIAPVLPDFVAELETLNGSVDVKEPGNLRRSLTHDFGKLGQALARAARDDGRLVIAVERRDEARELEGARKRVPDLVADVEEAPTPQARREARQRLADWIFHHGLEFVSEEHVIGRCAGHRLLQPGLETDHHGRALRLAKDAQALSSDLSDDNLAAVIHKVQEACEASTIALDQMRAVDEFTSVENLDRVVEWANNTPAVPGNFTRIGRLVVAGGRLSFGVDEDWRPPAMPILAGMKAALRA